MSRPANVPWGGRRGSGLHDGAQGPGQPTGATQFSSQWYLDASPGLLAHKDQATHERDRDRRGCDPQGYTPDGPTYHLVHGDVLAVVIQPYGHLGCEAELPEGEKGVL